jgi:uncharacterized FlgJ-related protein
MKNLYEYDSRLVNFVPIKNTYIKLKYVLLIVALSLLSSFIWMEHKKTELTVDQEREVLIISNYNKFSEQKFITMLQDMNFKFPDIVYAQAVLETGTFSSRIFEENNNLFGMKVSRLRPTTHKGEQHGHALYDDWRDSVVDYALYQARYLNQLKTRDEYLSYLDRVYAEDTLYVSKLKTIMEKNKSKF